MFEAVDKIKLYCNSLTKYSRYKTRIVKIGDIPLGGDYPIRIQSMTITDTMNTKETVDQTIRMVEAGCEYVRITAPSINEAANLENIKKELRSRGYTVPLIADIHFTPNAAELAARIVEKVRVNPGNYADKKKFENIEYTDSTYDAELERIRNKFTPLVKICKEYGTAMRIGTNHGSLSDRIMSRYGDTPLGMVESALEFVRICEALNYHEIVLSMKASNPQVMVQAYRLLIQKMNEEKMNYPLHLGVTEAGGGEDGRVKSAIGIGTLLEDGLGDTIRVSLTEDPEFEAPVAITLASRYKNRVSHKPIKPVSSLPYDPLGYLRRPTNEIAGIGGSNVPSVVADYSRSGVKAPSELTPIGYTYDSATDKWNMSDMAADILYIGKKNNHIELPPGLKIIHDSDHWLQLQDKTLSYPLFNSNEYLLTKQKSTTLNFVSISLDELNDALIQKIKKDKSTILVIQTENEHSMAELRRIFIELMNNEITNPAVIKLSYSNILFDQLQLFASTDMGGLLIDGFGDAVWLTIEKSVSEPDPAEEQNGVYVKSYINKQVSIESNLNRLLFGILQAARVRISKTEYIACPSCGRTLFDLQVTTELIRKRTEHLKGLKIAVMGCIVNGPGEMADADYGYVGSGVGQITLYRAKDIVKRNVPFDQAVEKLIEIIKEDGNWIEPIL